MELYIRPPMDEDLDQLVQVEQQSFPPQEAATRQALSYRIRTFDGCFFVAQAGEQVVGMINGCATDLPILCDELYLPDSGHNPQGKNQMVFDLAVLPSCRRQGVGSALLLSLIHI